MERERRHFRDSLIKRQNSTIFNATTVHFRLFVNHICSETEYWWDALKTISEMDNQSTDPANWGTEIVTNSQRRYEMTYYLCRLCAFKCLMPGIMIFSAEGMLRDIQRKIQECLQFVVCIIAHVELICWMFANAWLIILIKQVTEDDTYPKIVCPDCVNKLDALYEFKMKSLQSQNILCGNLYLSVLHKILSQLHVRSKCQT